MPTCCPDSSKALAAQTHQVEQTVAVDTASRDRSGAVLGELIGQDTVFGMQRSTGFGEAVAVALRHAAARRSGMTDPGLARVDWVWLLHDDCEPAPDALERLLRAASKDRSVVVLGPKVLDGQDRRTLREVGVSIDRAGRRVTGIDPGEIDQGQHDHKRAVLAVGSAGMLVRRDVWDRLGGFDQGLGLFRDDVDFCWRVQAAGYRVQVVTDAVLYHRELAGRRRRPSDAGNARQLDRRNALLVLAVNLPAADDAPSGRRGHRRLAGPRHLLPADQAARPVRVVRVLGRLAVRPPGPVVPGPASGAPPAGPRATTPSGCLSRPRAPCSGWRRRSPG